jgi:catechol 2,3-dioxygenase-like lactoylglutathione lyase family enzyme
VDPPGKPVQSTVFHGRDVGKALAITIFSERDSRTALTDSAAPLPGDPRWHAPHPHATSAPTTRTTAATTYPLTDSKGKPMTDHQPPEIPPTQTELPANPADVVADAAPSVRPGMFLLELVPVPVSDIDRAKTFYADQLGFHPDVDVRPADGVRIVQLTPPGSACSITLTTGIPWLDMPAGPCAACTWWSATSTRPARHSSTAARPWPGRGLRWGPLRPFADPDGNTWTLQHMPWRT